MADSWWLTARNRIAVSTRPRFLVHSDTISYRPFAISSSERTSASRGMCLGLVSSRIHGGNSRLLAAFEMPMVRSVVC